MQSPSPPERNVEVARVLDAIGDLMDLEGGNPFHVRAYKRAARRVRQLGRDVGEALEQGEEPGDLPMLREEIHRTVQDVLERGTSPRLGELLGRLPFSLRDLAQVPGLDIKRALTLQRALGVRTTEELEAAAREGRIQKLRGFGEKSERAILAGLRESAAATRRFRVDLAVRRAQSFARQLEQRALVRGLVVAGEVRRALPLVSGVDLVASSDRPLEAVGHVLAQPDVAEVVSRARTKASVRLSGGLRLDLHLVPDESRGAALLQHTGSRAHLDALRRRAGERALELNPFGVFDRARERLAGATEEEVYAALGLPFIPPELRSTGEEVQEAARGALPVLVEGTEVVGDLRLRCDPLEAYEEARLLAQAARETGLSWAVIMLPAPTELMGFDDERFLDRCRAFDALRAELTGIELASAVESGIDEQGALLLPEEALDEVDVVFAAPLEGWELDRRAQSERLLRALAHPRLGVLSRFTGHLATHREGLAVDLPHVLQEARRRGVAVELQGEPDLLDPEGTLGARAAAVGVPVVLSSAATAPEELFHLDLALGQARRARIGPGAVVNTLSLAQAMSLLRR